MIFPFICYKKQQEPCIAQGPSIKSALPWHGYYEDTKISLAMPPSNEKEYERNAKPGSHFDHRDGYAGNEVRRWKTQGVQHRKYRFWGPRGVGEVNTLPANVWVSRLRNPTPNVSLFHPRVFEFEVIDYIEDSYIRRPKDDYRGIPNNVVRAPFDWKPIERLPGPAVCFHVDTSTITAPNYFLATVLDDYDLLFVCFRVSPCRLGPSHIPPEEWVDLRNVRQLIFDIYDTLEVTLSPQAEANRLRAIEGLEDTSLVSSMETHHFKMNPYWEEEMAKGAAVHEALEAAKRAKKAQGNNGELPQP